MGFGALAPSGVRAAAPLIPGTDAGRVCQRALQGRKANQAYTAFHGGKGVRG